MLSRQENLFSLVCAAIFCPSCSFSSLIDGACSSLNTHRFIAEVCYDGSDFAGWQSQSTKRSVQGILNEALSKTYKTPVKVCGASRTDKGVHANGQIIHFDLPSSFANEDTIHTINDFNRKLPDDLKLVRWAHAPEGLLEIQKTEGLPFHAIENAISKNYYYEFSASDRTIDPMTTRYRASLYNYKAFQVFDIIAFQAALNVFLGKHDFRAFGNRLDVRAKKSEEYSNMIFSSVRTIESASIKEIRIPRILQFEYEPHIGDDLKSLSDIIPNQILIPPKRTISNNYGDKYSGDVFYRVNIVLDGALYKMLRNIIAGCAEVAYGTMSLLELRALLDGAVSRAENRLVTAPACGLYLQKVNYIEKMFDSTHV